VAFDHAKTEAMFLSKRRRKPTESVRVGEHDVPFNQHATRWLGVWIDSKMTLKEHHSARVKKAQREMHCIRRLTGQMGLCPDACKWALVACVQASALYGAELWWDDRKGEGVRRAPETGKPAGAGGDGKRPDDKSGGRDGRVRFAPGGEPTE